MSASISARPHDRRRARQADPLRQGFLCPLRSQSGLPGYATANRVRQPSPSQHEWAATRKTDELMSRHIGTAPDLGPQGTQASITTWVCADCTDASTVTLAPAFNWRNWVSSSVTVWSWSDEPRML